MTNLEQLSNQMAADILIYCDKFKDSDYKPGLVELLRDQRIKLETSGLLTQEEIAELMWNAIELSDS